MYCEFITEREISYFGDMNDNYVTNHHSISDYDDREEDWGHYDYPRTAFAFEEEDGRGTADVLPF